MSRCGYIIPPNLYPKTHVLKKKLILQPRNNQVQHIVVKVMGGTGERMGKRGKVTFFPECVRSPKEVRSFALVHGERANDRPKRCDRLLP
jgi:hypothetical protein